MHLRSVDLRTDDQQRAEHPYYPAFVTCGCCGITVDVRVPYGEYLEKAVQKWKCWRCGLTGEECPSGHMALVNAGTAECERAMLDEEFDEEDLLP